MDVAIVAAVLCYIDRMYAIGKLQPLRGSRVRFCEAGVC